MNTIHATTTNQMQQIEYIIYWQQRPGRRQRHIFQVCLFSCRCQLKTNTVNEPTDAIRQRSYSNCNTNNPVAETVHLYSLLH